jgi:hypothetical protein
MLFFAYSSINDPLTTLESLDPVHMRFGDYKRLCSPNEDFGSMNKRGNADFEGSTFQGRESDFYMVRRPKSSTHALEKCFLRNPGFIFCSSFQHLRLGLGEFPLLLIRPTLLLGSMGIAGNALNHF